jgi:hypothetical protein
MLFKESLYGWGVCDIPMPRSVHDIFADRRKKNNRLLNHRRPEQPGILAFISGLFIHDVPWLQILLQSIMALVCIVFIFLLSQMIPVFQDNEIPQPVDIMIKVIEDIVPPKAPPVQKAPVPLKKENLAKRTNQVIILKPESSPEEILPDVRIHRRIKRKPQKAAKNQTPKRVSFDKMAQSEVINIAIPRERKHKYNIKRTNMTATENRPQQPDSITEFNALPSEDQNAVVSSSNGFKKKYKVSKVNRDRVAPSNKAVSSLTPVDVPVAVIYPAKRSQKTYTVHAPGQNKVMPLDRSAVLLTQPNVPVKTVSYANHSQKKYEIGAANRDRIATAAKMSDSKPFASSLPVDSEGIALPEPDQTDVRYLSKKNETVYRSPTSSRAGSQPQFLIAKKDEMIEEESLTAPTIDALAKPAPKAEKSMRGVMSANPHRQSHDFAGAIDELDPAYLISLKALAVCLDPEEEFYLKTKLATLLGGPAKCESNGIHFFFKYTETGYTLKVEIYNPEGRLLQDRCAALHLAIEGVKNSKAKGVIP